MHKNERHAGLVVLPICAVLWADDVLQSLCTTNGSLITMYPTMPFAPVFASKSIGLCHLSVRNSPPELFF